MRTMFVAAVLHVAACVQAQEYRLPFDGRWFVAQGGDTVNVNHHMRARAQWYGIDFAKTGGPHGRALSRPDADGVEDFFCWGAAVRSPVAGEVVAAVDERPDNALGTKDERHPLGNHVVIRAAPDRYVFLAHLQRGSVAVRSGERVGAGALLGRCGNSGRSDYPHVHMHVQDTPAIGSGAGHNMVFHDIDVELTGRVFRDVDWPLIRGLFVANHRPAER